MSADMHLWDVEHPYRGPDCPVVDAPTFERLQDTLEALDQDIYFVWRWDWFRASAEVHDMRFQAGDDRSAEHLTVYVLDLDRGGEHIAYRCPVTGADEETVLEWLRGARIMGPLMDAWFPLLGRYDYEA